MQRHKAKKMKPVLKGTITPRGNKFKLCKFDLDL